jgi:prolyl-tRNA editing enzyme YbaK/EbsC (Cys-tRNA(Pro) deacylase)
VERTILDLPKIVINGGKRGFLVEIEPRVLVEVLKPTAVEVGFVKTGD